MKLMAILKALSYAKASDYLTSILLISDCEWCTKCIKREFDCASDDEFKRHKVSRGYVQYLQEIWWTLSGMQVRFQVETLE
jgi:ribonuclease HI